MLSLHRMLLLLQCTRILTDQQTEGLKHRNRLNACKQCCTSPSVTTRPSALLPSLLLLLLHLPC